jgi:DNA-binding MarR family transcriptional regulator
LCLSLVRCFLRTLRHPRHRHVQELHLTDAGREILHRADTVVTDAEAKITQELGHAKTARLKALLEQVATLAQKD